MSLRCALRCLTRPSCRLASGPLGGATACPLERRGMAGHSKWSNIRHVKAAKDGEKQRVAMMIVNRLKVVIRGQRQPLPPHSPHCKIELTPPYLPWIYHLYLPCIYHIYHIYHGSTMDLPCIYHNYHIYHIYHNYHIYHI